MTERNMQILVNDAKVVWVEKVYQGFLVHLFSGDISAALGTHYNEKVVCCDLDEVIELLKWNWEKHD